ncbi:MAG: hypothetical protein OEY63_01130 [Gemmatimonadota bacterium]|nr:hypothetical protein [Gemmatimonadota bacterium]MDH5804122.1 hypothetical protein [Gemmatimonadota bacterium]
MENSNSKWLIAGVIAIIAVGGVTFQSLNSSEATDATNAAVMAEAGTPISVYKNPT